MLKKLKNIAMWRGECVHWTIAQYLSGVRVGRPLSRETLMSKLQEKAQRDWQFSEQRQFRVQPGLVDQAGAALFEHEYDELPPGVSAESVYEAAGRMMGNFLTWADGPANLAKQVAEADRTWIEPPMFGADAPGFLVDGIQVLTKVDFAWEQVGSEFAIFDWKTGLSQQRKTEALSQYELQVGVYQLWPHRTLEVPLDRISSHLVYLGGESAAEELFKLDEEEATHVGRIVRESVRQTQKWEGYFAEGQMALDDLDYPSSVSVCRQCNFKRICRDGLKHRS
jgi:hypothetical protein